VSWRSYLFRLTLCHEIASAFNAIKRVNGIEDVGTTNLFPLKETSPEMLCRATQSHNEQLFSLRFAKLHHRIWQPARQNEFRDSVGHHLMDHTHRENVSPHLTLPTLQRSAQQLFSLARRIEGMPVSYGRQMAPPQVQLWSEIFMLRLLVRVRNLLQKLAVSCSLSPTTANTELNDLFRST
jgi:hypothetical protein